MSLPTKPLEPQPEDGSGPKPRDDQLPTEPSQTNPIARTRILTSGYIIRHPTLLRTLDWLGWNHPGASMNP